MEILSKTYSDSFADAYAYSLDWVNKKSYPFTTETIEADFKADTGLKMNVDYLPQIIVRLQAKSKIKPTGKTEKSQKKSRKGGSIKQWISISYSNSQRAKRENQQTRIARESQTGLDLFKTQN